MNGGEKMKQVFQVGDLVDIVPYDTVDDDYGIERWCWEYQRELNPQKIISSFYISVPDEDSYEIENDRYHFTWPSWAFVPHESTVSLCPVDDLI